MSRNSTFNSYGMSYETEETIERNRLQGQIERARVPGNYLLQYYLSLNSHLKTINEDWIEEFNQWRVLYRQPHEEDPTDFEIQELFNNQ